MLSRWQRKTRASVFSNKILQRPLVLFQVSRNLKESLRVRQLLAFSAINGVVNKHIITRAVAST